MLKVLASPFTGMTRGEFAAGYESADHKVSEWLKKRGHGPFSTRLVKLVPIVVAMVAAVNLAS